MEVHTLLIYFLASIILFFILNYVDKKKNSIIHYGIISSIYLLLLSGICTTLHLTKNNDAVFLVFILELLIRIFYINMIKEENFFKNKNNIKKYLIAFILVFSLNTFFISKVKTVFLDLEQIKMILWLLIIIYFINMYQNSNNKKEQVTKHIDKKSNKEKEQQEYIVIQYAKLKNQYSNFIKTRYKELIPLIYAIMIYENKNRPELFRKIDYYWYKINGKARKFGIMQIYSKYYIDDENSIDIAIRRLEKIYYSKIKQEKNERNILKEYYKKDYIVREILSITKEIKKFNQK